jgi:hypothetical protein
MSKYSCMRQNRQLGGFQVLTESRNSIIYRLNLYDYATLSAATNEAGIVVPEYCYYSSNVYVDTQQQLALELRDRTLNVWCNAACRGVSIPFLLQSLLLLQNKTFVHAAAISLDDRGILFPAFGGVGKTSLVARAAKEESAKILADDMVIVTEQGMLEPYLRPFALYEYHRSLFPGFFASRRIQFKPATLSWRVFYKVRSVLENELGLEWRPSENVVRTGYLPVAPREVLPEVRLATAPVKLDYIYILQRSSSSSKVEIDTLNSDQAVSFMLNVMYHEWYSQLRLLLSWLAHRSVSFAAYLTQVEAILGAAVSNSRSVSLVSIPLHMSPTDIGEELVQRVAW